jgi:hypothetical protein
MIVTRAGEWMLPYWREKVREREKERERERRERERESKAAQVACRGAHQASTPYSDGKSCESDDSGLAPGDRKWPLNEAHRPNFRGVCSPRYGLHSWRRESAGVAKRPRERSPTRNSLTVRFAFAYAAVWVREFPQPRPWDPASLEMRRCLTVITRRTQGECETDAKEYAAVLVSSDQGASWKTRGMVFTQGTWLIENTLVETHGALTMYFR